MNAHLPQRISSISPTILELDAQGSESHFTFAAFWHIVVKRIATIVTATLLVSVLTGIYTFKMAPVYRATATMRGGDRLPPTSIHQPMFIAKPRWMIPRF